MKKLLGVLVLGLLVSFSAFASNLNPEKILNNVDDIYRSNASYGILILSVTTTNWQRTLTLEQWSKGSLETFSSHIAYQKLYFESHV